MGDIAFVHDGRELIGHLWQQIDDGLPLSDDLSSSVAEALGGKVQASGPIAIHGIELTANGLNLVNGRYAMPTGDPRTWELEDARRFRGRLAGLSLYLSNSAKMRLKTQDEQIIALIRQVSVVFPSHFSMLVAELEILRQDRTPVSSIAIEEALHILSNRNRTASCGLASVSESVGIDFQSLLHSVILPAEFEIDDRIRMFTYSVLTLQAFPQDLSTVDTIAFRCARHHTADYQVAPEEISKGLYRPFQTVVHHFSLEGAASLCDGSDPFLSEQFLTRVQQAYLWLVVLACHEHAYLLWLLRRDPLSINRAEEKHSHLATLIDDFLGFRLAHNLPLVSHLEMHNQSYQRLRERMFLNELVQKVTRDVVEVERWLAQQSEAKRSTEQSLLEAEKQRRRGIRLKFATGEILVAAFLMFGLTFLAFDALTHKVAQLIWKADPPQPWNILWPVGIGLVAAIYRGWQVRGEIFEDPVSEGMMEFATSDESIGAKAAVGILSKGTP